MVQQLMETKRLGEISEIKFEEFLAIVEFIEFAFKTRLSGSPRQSGDLDEAFKRIRAVVIHHGGRGDPVIRFDTIFRFALDAFPDLLAEFLNIV